MIIFPEPVPDPPAPDIMRWTRDGRALPPQVEYERRLTAWLTRMAAFYGTSPLAGTITPTTASIAAAGATGRLIAVMSGVTGGVQPVTWSVFTPAGIAAAFTGNALLSTANPIGTVGAHAMTIRATDALGAVRSSTLTVTLT
jgi:hypothetical protein